MRRQETRLPSRQSGQAMILGLFLALTAGITLFLMYNTGQVSSEKARLVNAADAAAYSGGVFLARNLNFMAYTNRAMIANHVAVGHLVSYVSWLNYVKDSTSKLATYTRFIPYVNVATAYADRIVRKISNVTNRVSNYVVKAADYLNYSLFTAQQKSKLTINGVMSISSLLSVKIMDKVAKQYHPQIRVNYPSDLSGLSGVVSGSQIIADMSRIFGFIRQYNASNDNGRIKRMIEASYDVSDPWIRGNRGWGINLGLWKLNKDGSTQHTQNSRLANWEASDALTYRWWTPKGWKSTTVASGSASARGMYSDYRGVQGYHDLSNIGDDNSQSLNVTAYATLPMQNARLMNMMGLKSGSERLGALARAEVYHKRPEAGFNSIRPNGEYANLYNPFWQVRLTKNWY